MDDLTQSRLKYLLDYDKSTGIFIWVNPRQISLKGKVAGRVDSKGHVQISVDGRRYAAHRLAWFYVYGEWPKKIIDHIDGNKANNSIINLRDATRTDNSRNARLRKDNLSGLSGVRWINRTSKWAAFVSEKRTGRHIYYGDDFFEACCKRKSYENANGYSSRHGRM